MKQENSFRHAASLPFGYRAVFQWSPDRGFEVEWEPSVPSFRHPRAQRKFMTAYVAARRAFMANVATVIGGAVLILDSVDDAEAARLDFNPVDVVLPCTKH